MKKTFQKFSWLLLLLLVVGVQSCSEDEPMDDPVLPSSAKDITSLQANFLSFSGKSTSSLGTKSGSTYEIILPTHLDLTKIELQVSLSQKAKAYAYGKEFVNGIGIVDVTDDLIIKVEAEDGTKKSYVVVRKDIDVFFKNSVEAFRKKYNIKGISIALAKDEKLVYAGGFGWANEEKNEPVNVDTRFRVASVSKSITAIMMMKLIDDGKLASIESKVFGPEGVLNDFVVKNKRFHDITIRDLLQHTAGLPSSQNDQAFNPDHSLDTEALAKHIVKTFDLEFDPGSKHGYSNTGFMIASLVIERLSEMTFDEYIQEVYRPVGITGIQVATNNTNNLHPNESKSYDATFDPYSFYLPRILGAGALIASAKDLAQVIVYTDKHSVKKDILSQSSLDLMTTHNEEYGYGLGWGTSASGNYWHVGSVPGTLSYFYRYNGWSMAIISNTTDTGNYNSEFFQLLTTSPQGVIDNLPTYDLF